MQTIAIVGASLAGLSAARALRSRGYCGRLVLIGEEIHRPYDRPPLSKDFLAGRIGVADLSLESVEDNLDAEWRLGVAATGLDPEQRRIALSDGTALNYDGVVIATGASARALPQLAGKRNVHTLRTLPNAQALQEQLRPGRRLLVIGAGFIGAEVASTAKSLGLDVTVLEMGAVPLSGPLGPEMGAELGRLHSDHGVELLCGARIESFATDADAVTGVRLDDGRTLDADVVVVGIGAVPNVQWLQGSGLDLSNGIVCDAAGRTGIPGVVAVGDCAAWFDPRHGTHHRVEHWTGALERPAVAAAALLDEGVGAGELTADGEQQTAELPYFWSDQYGVRLQFVGHARAADRVVVEAGDPWEGSFLSVYYRGDTPVAVLGVNQTRLFTRWRKSLNRTTPHVALAPNSAVVPASFSSAVPTHHR